MSGSLFLKRCASMTGYFLLARSGTEFTFTLKATKNNETLLTSERYTTKHSANNGILSVKQNAPLDARYLRLVSANGLPYFVLTAANGETIGTSEMYSSASARDAGIESAKTNAPSALKRDET